MTPIEHWRTMDERGMIMPWYTRPCLEWLITLPLDQMSVFEYGCGNSTFWYKSVGANTFGVDDKLEWLPELLHDHAFLKEQCAYTMAIQFYGRVFDLIIIDGLYRDDCTEFALRCLAPGGYLIADNFEQPSADLANWPKTRELTKHLPLTLYKEPEHSDWQTAVFHNV